ncbi:phage shock protein C (PspC) family protein [Paenibacillus sp. UNCCL117]|uniref:PspC domain-containing protein n=1 Tax=unclassified Paenibacillus TaxID=185978 RepID=UPI0008893BD1|nr:MULTISPECIES: PspC domain-containing protein [unclassified Paenibacillus]SDE16235.1 Phage shock protein PspC (stress-responsive transcriptional regulator) [Paenibacillus sp. cl123]SFW61109.1 phage shock protein C (PspC) family protein [Paenibacillus sp. UNCCL117]
MTKLYRSRTDRKLTGLCGGLASMMGIDSTLLRLIVVLAAVFTSGVVLGIYVLAALVIPSEPYYGGPYGPGPGPGHAGPYDGRGEHNFSSWKDWRRAERHFRKAQKYGWGSYAAHGGHREYDAEYAAGPQMQGHHAGSYSQSQHASEPTGSDLDDMMKDIEKKAMWKEIEELRAKVAKYEKQQQNQNQPTQTTKGEI